MVISVCVSGMQAGCLAGSTVDIFDPATVTAHRVMMVVVDFSFIACRGTQVVAVCQSLSKRSPCGVAIMPPLLQRGLAHNKGAGRAGQNKTGRRANPTTGFVMFLRKLSVQALSFRRDHAGVEASKVQATVEPCVFDLDAAVHHHGQPEVFSNLGCFIRPDA